MSDDLTVDFTDTESYGGGFEPIPRNWYKVVISDWETTEVKKVGGAFPQGTPGTKWELTVDEGEFENRKLWITHWHHPTSLPFLKGFLEATGKFESSELSGQVDLNDVRERAVGSQLQAKVAVRPAKGDYEASNEIKSVKPIGDSVSESDGSLRP